MTLDGLTLRPQAFFDQHNISLKLGAPVTAIDKTAKTVTVGDEVISYDLWR